MTAVELKAERHSHDHQRMRTVTDRVMLPRYLRRVDSEWSIGAEMENDDSIELLLRRTADALCALLAAAGSECDSQDTSELQDFLRRTEARKNLTWGLKNNVLMVEEVPQCFATPRSSAPGVGRPWIRVRPRRFPQGRIRP